MPDTAPQTSRNDLPTGVEQAFNVSPALPGREQRSVQPADNMAAIIYCEGHFGGIDGKTANGLVRRSEKYRILSVIDAGQAGQDTGQILDGLANGIPVHRTLENAFRDAPQPPHHLIIGMAPSDGRLSATDRNVVFEALALGMNVVSGLHEYLGEDAEMAAAAQARGLSIIDVRKPKPSKDMRLFDGSIDTVACPRIAVLGTDCAIGKRTTATILTQALRNCGVHAVMVGTGQTGLLQGAKHGVALDSVPSQFCCGELEGAVVGAYEAESPDIIIVEGQGALSHPAFCTSAFILRGSKPDGVILQHAPKRAQRCDFPDMDVPDPASEIALIEAFADTKVVGLSLNHEGMNPDEIGEAIASYESALGMPVTDALSCSPKDLVEIILLSFPELFTNQTGKSAAPS